MTTVEFLAADVALLVVVLVWWIWSHARERNMWPTPLPRHGCVECGESFLDQRGLEWHRKAAHRDTYGEHVEPTTGCWYPYKETDHGQPQG